MKTSVKRLSTLACWPRKASSSAQPYTRQLRGKLYIGRERYRVSYYVATGRRIILLTVFRKTRRRERAEVERAERAMKRCIAEGHTEEE